MRAALCILEVGVLSTVLLYRATGDQLIRPGYRNPGVVLRLNERSVQSLKKEVLMIIGSLRGLRMNDVFEKPVKRLRLTMQNMQIVSVTPPSKFDIMFIPNSRDQVRIEMAGLGLTTTAVVSTQFKNFKNMFVTTAMQGLSLNLQLRMYADINGHMQVLIEKCMANLADARIDIAHTRRVPTNTQKLAGKLQRQVEEKLCPFIQSKLVQQVNKYLGSMKSKTRLVELFQPRSAYALAPPKTSVLLNTIALEDPAVYSSLAKHTVLDYSIMPEPHVVQPSALEIPLKGEISWDGRGGTPFIPPSIRTGPFSSQHMADFISTDYPINSMLANYHNRKIFEYRVTSSHPHYGKYVRDSCAVPMCIGVVLPDIGKRYPGTQNEIFVKTTSAPKVVIKDGAALVYIPMQVSVCAVKGRSIVPVLTIAMKPVLNLHIIAKNQKLYARITEKDKNQIEMFTDITKSIIIETIRLALRDGMSFRIPGMITVRSMTPRLIGNSLVVGLMTEMNRAKIGAMVVDNIRKLTQYF
ncbi:unnamed protein product [Soboliphyme baturini]|uniref:BPI2 domain-containing protein n=1 Tax=Soboliphyme baturini TaxID=241478 RepID=A0A183J1B8_9BILA|nr:unnamed protein product [Soboliphyme baturini]